VAAATHDLTALYGTLVDGLKLSPGGANASEALQFALTEIDLLARQRRSPEPVWAELLWKTFPTLREIVCACGDA
jgi:hypothetical protein